VHPSPGCQESYQVSHFNKLDLFSILVTNPGMNEKNKWPCNTPSINSSKTNTTIGKTMLRLVKIPKFEKNRTNIDEVKKFKFQNFTMKCMLVGTVAHQRTFLRKISKFKNS
jgi:hypothetical protein